MALHPSKENALLQWINNLHLGEPLERLGQLQDGHLLLKLVYKLKGEEPSEAPVHLPPTERLSIVSDFIYSVCQKEHCALSWDDISTGSDVELAKVVLLLCYYGFINMEMVSRVEHKTQLQMGAMFHYVQGGTNSLSLSNSLDKILTMNTLLNWPSSSSTSSLSDDDLPIFKRSGCSPHVSFLELNTVASSSFDGSPVQEVMNTPKVQLRRLRKELAREGDVRDELEQELADCTSTLSEKESQISQLQHRLQRLLRDQEELEKNHKTTLIELQEKNEGLLKRLHEVLKQCQDLKTDNGQKEKQIDELTEENGTLAAQVRNTFAQLTSGEEEMAKITEAHESSQAQWCSSRDSLQKELSQALADRESLGEQIQILQGKISVLEDELAKVSVKLQEKGEVLGPIMEQEQLKQDLADLTLKHSQLEREKLDNEVKLQQIITKHQSKISELQCEIKGNIESLKQSECKLCALKENVSSKDKELVDQQEKLAHLQCEAENLRKELMQQERNSEQLSQNVASKDIKIQQLKGELELKEEELQSLKVSMQVIQAKSSEMHNLHQREVEDQRLAISELKLQLTDAERAASEKVKALDDLGQHLKNLKEEVSTERQKAAALEKNFEDCKEAHATQQQALELEVRQLQQEINGNVKNLEEAENLRKELMQQERNSEQLSQNVASKDIKIQQLKGELELKEEELQSLKVSMQVIQAKSSEMHNLHQREVEDQRLAISELKLQLTDAERAASEKVKALDDLGQHLKNLKEEVSTERQKAAALEKNFEDCKEAHATQQQTLELEVRQLQQEINGNVKNLEEAENLRKELMQQERNSEQLSQNVASKDIKIQQLKGELELKEEELQSLKVSMQVIQAKSSEMHNLHQREVEDQRLAISELKLQLTDAERAASEKVKALDDLGQHLKNLKEEVSTERQKAAALEKNFEDCKEAHATQQQTLELEVRQLQQEINGNVKNLEEAENLRKELMQQERNSEQLSQNVASKDIKIQQLKGELELKEEELQSLKVSMQVIQAKSSEMHNLHQREVEDQRLAISELKLQLTDAERAASEKVKALDDLGQHLKNLKEEVSTERQKAAALEKNFEDCKEAHATQQQTLELEVRQLQQEINGNVKNLEEAENLRKELMQQERNSEQLSQNVASKDIKIQQLKGELELKEEELQSLKVSMQVIQAKSSEMHNLHQREVEDQRLAISELKLQLTDAERAASEKVKALDDLGQHLKNLKEEVSTERQKAAALEKNFEDCKEAHATQQQTLELEVRQLQQEINGNVKNLEEAENLRKELMQQERNSEQLSQNVASKDIKIQQLKGELELKEEELQSLKVSMQVIQAKSSEMHNLHQREVEDQRLAISELKLQLTDAERAASEKVKALDDLGQHLKNLKEEVSTERQKAAALEKNFEDCKEAHATQQQTLELEVRQLQQEINGNVKNLEEFLTQIKSLQQELSHQRDISLEQEKEASVLGDRYKALEEDFAKLQNKLAEAITLAEERQSDLLVLREEGKHQENLRVKAEENEELQRKKLEKEVADLRLRVESQRIELEAKVAQLQVQVEKTSKVSSERESEMNLLHSEIAEHERQKREACQAQEVLETAVTELRIEHKQEQDGYHQKLNALKKEKDDMSSIIQSLQKDCQSLQHEYRAQQEALNDWATLKKENKQFSSLNHSLQRERDSSQKIAAELELKLEERNESIRALRQTVQEREKQNQELQEQLKQKSEVVEHYKAQVEKAKIHYSGKKQQLVEELNARQTLQASLEASETEVKALRAELRLVSMELDNVKTSEKSLMAKVTSLEAQVAYADLQLREQNREGDQRSQVKPEGVPTLHVPEVRNVSADSLDLDLDDSLNTISKPSVPGESSTPLVRSSERLAAKRRCQGEGSLETLFFTPMNPRSRKHRDGKQQCKLMPPGGGAEEMDESFYSLHSTHSQLNLASQKPRPVSMEILEQPNIASSSDKLLSLPGYRRSSTHCNPPPRATSTFCVGTENEPDHVADDWMRIAELQSRNKACLPHLKSSYPLEARPSLGYSCLPITDEDVRTGDPDDTIRRASMIPGQLLDSLSSHRLSLALPVASRYHGPSHCSVLPTQTSCSTAVEPSRGGGRPGQVRPARAAPSPLAPKRPAGQLQHPDTPEAKKLASCFPRPATPKGRNLRSTSSNSVNKPNSSSDRRLSMAFVIDNTPNKSGRGNSRLQRGISKLRNSARKSPASTSRLARCSAANGRSPMVNRPQAKSPHTTSTKSPNIPTSAKKLLKFRMKI